jgi:hypothetical protein
MTILQRLLEPSLLKSMALGVIALVLGLAVNSSCFEMSQDGAGWQTYMDYQVQNRTAYSQLGADAHQGDFDAYYPLINDYTIPGALFRLAGKPDAPGPTATYAIYSIFLFAVVFLLGRSFGIDVATALLASFIALFFFPPLVAHSGALTFRFMHLNPHWMQLIIFSTLMILSVWKLDGRWTVGRIVLICLPALAVSIEVLSVGAMVIFTPAVAPYGLGAVYFSKNRQALIQKLIAGVLAVAVVIATGQATYLYGIVKYSAYDVFGNEFDWDWPYFSNLSIAFDYPFGFLLIVLGLVGARLAMTRKSGLLGQLGATHLVATGLFFVACVIFYVWASFAGYRSSAPLYFETTYMAFAALFASLALVRFVQFLLEFAAARGSWASRWPPSQAGLLSLSWLALLLCAINVVSSALVPDLCYDRQAYGHIRSNEIIEVLRANVALKPGSPFRGNVATIDWVEDKPDAVDFSVMYRMNLRLRAEIGNDLRMFGLWHFGIPSMYQYFTFITAPYYLVMTEFLSRPQDRQTRSGLVLTHIDPGMLKLWGVRYLVTDHQTDVGREVISHRLSDGRDVRLVELDKTNLGNYSPTTIRRVATFHEGLSLMHQPGFDGTKTVIVDATVPPLAEPLVPATNASLVYETFGFHIWASSAGNSILVLPPQYSRCWSVEGTGSPRLFRANMMQMGIAFSGDLDARLVLRNGPLFAGSCRLDDARDMERLDIANGRVVKRILPD